MRVTVIQVLNMLCRWVEDPNSEAYKRHLARIKDYLWVAEDGMKMQVRIQELDKRPEYLSIELLLDYLIHEISCRNNFEFIQAVIRLFLKV